MRQQAVKFHLLVLNIVDLPKQLVALCQSRLAKQNSEHVGDMCPCALDWEAGCLHLDQTPPRNLGIPSEVVGSTSAPKVEAILVR